MTVRVPASSANLGPGFDVLGMAVSMHALLGVVGVDPVPEGARTAEQRHPASVAFSRAGGRGEVWVRPRMPMGRGLGFSGAMRVGGAVLAHAQEHGDDLGALDEARPGLCRLAGELEGHADNAAASMFGGVVAVVGERVVRLPLALGPAVLVWVPSATTRTDESRARLPPLVERSSAVHNVARAVALTTALVTGEVDLLRLGSEDRLHQHERFAANEASRLACETMLAAGVWSAWLSGSGPSVAAFCHDDAVAPVVAAVDAALPGAGRVHVLHVDHEGATILGGPDGPR